MANKTLTAANSVYLLSITGLYVTPQRLQGFGADAAFDTDAVEPAEVMIGVDGKMSAGYVPVLTPQTITLQADSASNAIFDTWNAAQKAAREIMYANATISVPSLGLKYTLTRGVLTSYVAIPGVRKVLQPKAARITWESVSSAPA
jgi:hypothetical protein